ncbi:MAG: O-antigen ligase family protein [Pseudorhodoplanes sp.]
MTVAIEKGTGRFDRVQWRNAADVLAAAVAATIPWSTSVSLIAIVLWLIALLPTVRPDDLRDVMRHPAAFVPVALVALAAIGMLWADVPWKDRLDGFGSFARFLLLPLLFVQFRNSERWRWLFGAFLASCALLMVVSFAGIAVGEKFPWRFKTYGVPVRDYISQSGEFILCAAGLVYVAVAAWSERRTLVLLGAIALAALFIANVVFVAPSRTALVTIPALLVLFAITQCRLKAMLAFLAAIAVLCAIVWVSSVRVQQRLIGIITEVQTHQANQVETSAGLRVDFWRQSIRVIQEAPVIGHGTGALRASLARAAVAEGKTPTVNPHNQSFTVAIQLGFAGMLLLVAMWLAHGALFLRGTGLVAWLGLAIVAQNFVGCLFNNHLFDFTQGWIYVFGVGTAGGVLLARSQGTQTPP